MPSRVRAVRVPAVALTAVALVVAVLLGAFGGTRPAGADVSLSPAVSGMALHDRTVMQSMAYDPVSQSWVFAQVTGTGRFGQSAATHSDHGDMTLTRVSRYGRNLGYMYLRGFGHGISIGVQWSAGRLWVWTEATSRLLPAVGQTDAAVGVGTQVARFAWQSEATLTGTSRGVERFGSNAGQGYQSPSLDLVHGLIGVRYFSTGLQVMRWAVYPLAEFEAHHYAAIARLTIPAAVGTSYIQGWAVDGPQTLLSYNGSAYSDANPAPGNAMLSYVATDGRVSEQQGVTAAADLAYREPEGLTAIGGNHCVGFASGPVGDRLANVWCESSPYGSYPRR